MLSIVAIATLHKIGAQAIDDCDKHNDPTTEEEFLRIPYRPATVLLVWNDYLAEFKKQLAIREERQLRYYRNMLLQKTDWMMQPDVINTIANKEEWIAYRQSLRDLPTSITEYIWIGNYAELDFKNMNIPQPPPITRLSSLNSA